MLNYKSIAGDPLMPFIRCSLPNDMTDSCRLFDWENNAPEIDGQQEKLFWPLRQVRPGALSSRMMRLNFPNRLNLMK